MALFRIVIQKVVVEQDEEVKKLLREIRAILDDQPLKKEIAKKLDKLNKDIKNTI